MPTWLIVLAAVIVLAVLGLATAGTALVGLGLVVLVVGLVGIAHGRGRTRV